MYAKKANKTYQIETAQEMQNYLRQGFDIYNEQDEIVKHNPAKTIAYTEYQRLLEENQRLKEENQQAREGIVSLMDENAKLLTQLTEAEPEPEPFAAIEGQTTLPPEESPLAQTDEVKTLVQPADGSIPKMGAKSSKAKATADKTDGDAK